jgi:hypothetical protein
LPSITVCPAFELFPEKGYFPGLKAMKFFGQKKPPPKGGNGGGMEGRISIGEGTYTLRTICPENGYKKNLLSFEIQ